MDLLEDQRLPQLEHVGLNHLSWERAVRVDGVDRLPEILSTRMDLVADETDIPAELIGALGAIPSYYLHYYYLTDEVIERQRTERTRAEAQTILDDYQRQLADAKNEAARIIEEDLSDR